MELEVTARERNGMMDRDELELALDHSGEATPAESEIRSRLAAEEDLDPETIVVETVSGAYGTARSTATVHVYDEPMVELADEEPDEPTAEDAGEDADADEDEQAADDEDAADTDEEEEESDDAEETDADSDEEEDAADDADKEDDS